MANYYVRTNGNDLAAGTSDNDAYATLGKAVSVATGGTDTIYVAKGFNSAGEAFTAAANVTVKCYDSAKDPSDGLAVINAAEELIGETWTTAGGNLMYFDITGDFVARTKYVRFKGLPAALIRYAGAGATAKLTINSTGATITTTVPSATQTFLFTSYPTLGTLAAAIHAYPTVHADWTCTLVSGTSTMPSTMLLAVTDQDVKTANYYLKADYESCHWIGGKEVTTPAAAFEWKVALQGGVDTRVTIYVPVTNTQPGLYFTGIEVFNKEEAAVCGARTVVLDGLMFRGWGGHTAGAGIVGAASMDIRNCIVLDEVKKQESAYNPVCIWLTAAGALSVTNSTLIGGNYGVKADAGGTVYLVNNLFLGQTEFPAGVASGTVTHGNNKAFGWYNYYDSIGSAPRTYLVYAPGSTRYYLGGDSQGDDPRELRLGSLGFEWPAAMANVSLDPTYNYTDAFDALVTAQKTAGPQSPLAIGALPSGYGWGDGITTAVDGLKNLVSAGSEVVNMSATRTIFAATGEGATGGSLTTYNDIAFSISTILGSTSANFSINQTTGLFTTSIDGAPGLSIDITTGGVRAGYYKAIDGYMTIGELVATIDATPGYEANITRSWSFTSAMWTETAPGSHVWYTTLTDATANINRVMFGTYTKKDPEATVGAVNAPYEWHYAYTSRVLTVYYTSNPGANVVAYEGASNVTVATGYASCACLPTQGPTDISFDSIVVAYSGSADATIQNVGGVITIAETDVPAMRLEYLGSASAATVTVAASHLTTALTSEPVFEIQCTAGTSGATAATMTIAAHILTTTVTNAEAFDIAYAGLATAMLINKDATNLWLYGEADVMDLEYTGAATTALATVIGTDLDVALTFDAMDIQYVGAGTTCVMDIAGSSLTTTVETDAFDIQYVGAGTTCVMDIAANRLTTTVECDAMTLTYGGGGATCVADYTGGHLTTTVGTADAFDVQYVGLGTGCDLDIVAGTSLTTTMIACPAIDIDYTGGAVAGTVTVGAGGFIRGNTTAGVDDFIFFFSTLTTVQDVVDAINALANWSAAINTEGRAAWASTSLDLIANVDAKGATAVMAWSGVDLNLDLTNPAYGTMALLVAAVDDAAVHYTATITHADYNLWPTTSLDAVAAQDIQAGAYTATYSGVDLDLDLTAAANDTVAELCAVIHAKSDYTCVIGDAEFNTWLSANLDNLVAEDVTGGGHVCTWTGTDLDLDLTAAANDTVAELVGVINPLGPYTCVITAAEFNTWLTTGLDAVAAQDVLTGVYTATWTGTDINIDLTAAATDTIGELCTVVHALPGYTCVLADAEWNTWASTNLDAVAAQDVLTAPYTATGGGAAYSFDLTAAANDTINELVGVIDALPVFTCTIANAEFASWPSINLDGIAAPGQSLVGAAYTFAFTGPCVTYALADAANDTVNEIVTILNARTGITCTITHANYAAWPTTSLVAMTAQDITGAGHTALYTGVDLSYDLTAGTSDILSEVVALITAKVDYTCTLTSADFATWDASTLDAVAGQDILSAPYDALWSGQELDYDLTNAAYDTLNELALTITSLARYTCETMHADYDSLDSDTLSNVAAHDITSVYDMEVSGITYSFDTANASYDTYQELVTAIGAYGFFTAGLGLGTVGTDDSAGLSDFAAIPLSGAVTLTTPLGTALMNFASVFAAEFDVTKDWLAANVPGSHGEIVLWPYNWHGELGTTAKATLAAAAAAAGITMAREAYPYPYTADSYINHKNSYEGGQNVYAIRGVTMSATVPEDADEHVRHMLTWARVRGFPLSFLGHFTSTTLSPDTGTLDAYVKAIHKYGRYQSFNAMAAEAARWRVRTAPYEFSPAWKNLTPVPAPDNHSCLYKAGRIVAGIHTLTGYRDAMANTYPPLQAQKFGLRKAGETEWSAQRQLAFFIDGAPGETIEISAWAITPSVAGAHSFSAYTTIGALIDHLIGTHSYTVLTHVQCVRSLPTTCLELVAAGTSIAAGLWIHFYPADLNPAVGAIEHVVKLGQPKELWRK